MARTRIVTDLRALPTNQNGRIRILPEHITDHAEAITLAVEAVAELLMEHAFFGSGILLSWSAYGSTFMFTGAGVTQYGAIVWAQNASVDTGALADGTYYIVLRALANTRDVTFADPETGETITHTMRVGSGMGMLSTNAGPDDAVLGLVTKVGATMYVDPYRPRQRPARSIWNAQNSDVVTIDGANVVLASANGSPGMPGKVRVLARGVVTASSSAAGWVEVVLRAYAGMGTPQTIGVARGYSSAAGDGANIAVQGQISLTPGLNEAVIVEMLASTGGSYIWSVAAGHASLSVEVEADPSSGP